MKFSLFFPYANWTANFHCKFTGIWRNKDMASSAQGEQEERERDET